MKIASIIFLILVLGGAIYYTSGPQVIEVKVAPGAEVAASVVPEEEIPGLPDVGSSPAALKDPPIVAFGEYFSGWSAGLRRRMDPFIASAGSMGLNAAVIDIKDYSGYVSYKMDVPGVIAAGADREIRTVDIDSLIRDMHAQGIYVIGRVTVFQDSVLTKARPELALKDKRTGKLWKDRKGLAWLDPAGKESWDYSVAIAKDAFDRGFDEVNFDYVRFPSDGDLDNAAYPFWNKEKPRHEVLREFFAYLRTSLPGKKISADVFGLTTVADDDLGIGQILEDALANFDYVAPMIYPSHFAPGFQGYKNPAAAPYPIIKYSMEKALAKWQAAQAGSSVPLGRFRPWLQAFDLGAEYTPQMVQDQIRALSDVFATTSEAYAGWLLWDPANEYKSYKLIPN